MMNQVLKKRITRSILKCFLTMTMAVTALTIVPMPKASAAIQATYYVSPSGNDSNAGTPSGNDSNAGTLSAPFKTIQKAKDIVKTIRGNMTGDINVYLRGGTYEQSSTITFTDNDGGSNGYYVNYMAYGSEKPVISGGKRITGWTQVSGQNYYVADVPLSAGYTDYFRQLYVNGVRAYRASGPWVNGISYYDSPYMTDTTIDGINFSPLSVKIYSNPTDIRLLHINSFKIDEWPVVNVGVNGNYHTVRAAQPHFQIRADRGYMSPTDKYMIVNAFEELDTPGEWYLNRVTRKVYYYPYSKENMSTAEVYAPAIASDQLVKFEGSSTSNLVRNIRLKGITLEHGNWLFPKDYFIGGSQAEALYSSSGVNPSFTYGDQVPGNISLNHTSGIQFIGNTIRHMGASGIHLYNDASNTLIQGNIFFDLTGAGVEIGRFLGAYMDNDIPGEAPVKDNTITNNVIRDTGRDFMAATGISIMPAQRTTITHNDIDNTAYMGIHSRMQVLGNYTTKDVDVSQDIGQSYIAYNKIGQSNWAKLYGVNDNASIYNFGPSKGTQIIGNYVTNASSADAGIYNDDNSYQITWKGNVILKGLNLSPRSVDPSTILFDSNYGTASKPSSSNAVVTNYTKLTSTDISTWPQAAKDIANQAGLESAYAGLLNHVPATPGYGFLNSNSKSNSLANSSTKTSDSGGWSNLDRMWDGTIATGEAQNEANESWVQFDLGGDYDHFVFRFTEDEYGAYQVTEWKVQRWSASQNAWIDIMPYQISNTNLEQRYTPTSSLATTKLRLYVRNTASGGKIGMQEFKVTGIPKIPPVTTDDAPQGWVNHDVAVHLTATGSGSGVAATFYTLDGGAQQTGTRVNITEEGNHSLYYWSVDNAGKVEAGHTVSVKIDKTPPVTTAAVSPAQPDGLNGWYVHAATVSFNVYDNLSGVAKTEYSLDGGSTWLAYTAPVTLSQDGKYTVSYRSTDNAGNVEAIKTIGFNLDATAPTITVSGLVYGTYSDSMDITPIFTLGDNLSGVDSSKTTVMVSTYGVKQTVQQGAAIPMYTLSLGTHTLIVTASDLAGNTGSQTVEFQTTTSIQSLQALVTRFTNSGWINNAGIANGLQRKLAANALADFVSEVQAQSGKHISAKAAGYLIRDAEYLLSNR